MTLDRWLAETTGQDEAVPPPTAEQMLCGKEWFGLTGASPLQRAICRWADGLPVDHEALDAWLRKTGEAYADDIRERMCLGWILGGVLGGTDYPKVTERPEEIVNLSGIRAAKTKMAQAILASASQRVEMDHMDPYEYAIGHTVSLKLALARVAVQHLHAAGRRDGLQSIIEGHTDPTRFPKDGLDLKHPSGRTIKLQVSHGGRAGGGLVASWVAGVVFDESARMLSAEDGVINVEHAREAVLQRILPGGQIIYPTSPWAPLGFVFDMVRKHHGKPGRWLVVRAPGPAMWPGWWTPARCEAARKRDEAGGPSGDAEERKASFTMDVLGEFGEPEQQMFGMRLLDSVCRGGDIEPNERCTYYAYMDPATRGNAWTLVVGAKLPQPDGTSKATQVLARDWTPRGGSLDPKAVLREAAEALEPYDVDHVETDQWAADAIISIGREVGLRIMSVPWTAKRRLDGYDSLRAHCRVQTIELHEAVRADLTQVRRRLTTSGATIVLPESGGGRHCDFAPPSAAMALDCETWDEPREHIPGVDDPDFAAWHRRQERERMMREAAEVARGHDEDDEPELEGFGEETDEWNEQQEEWI